MSGVRRGCLALADISGYTRYLTGVELEHSHDVLADLLGVVARELAAVGALAKLEGDAVFVCDRGGRLGGEDLLAALDAAYLAFVRRRRTISVRTTCGCDACAQISSLDLKFVAHHGEFVEHVVAGSWEVVGADVIVVHRLLKNDVPAATGVSAFAFLTDACTVATGLDPERLGLLRHSEHYEELGEVAGWVRDVGARADQLERAAAERVEPGQGLIEVSVTCPAPRGRVWEALLDPASQLRWRSGASAVEMESPAGARGPGTRTHCVHGEQTFDQEILAWRPFDYYTYREEGPYGPFLWTFEVGEEQADGTPTTVRVRPAGGRRQRLVMAIGRSRMQRIVERNMATLAEALSTEASQ
jgi:uncharacterized protein YndB with AHSA1/START domain